MAMKLEARLQDRQAWTIGDKCSAGRVLDLLSTKTAFLVVRECFYGTTRFDDFVARVGASAPAVSRALKQLETAGVVVRSEYRDSGQRSRNEYRLTPAGEDLLPVFLSLIQWGDQHLQDGRPPLSFVDAETDEPVVVVVTTSHELGRASEDLKILANRRWRPSA